MTIVGRAARGAAALLVSLTLLAAVPAVPALGLSKSACRVRNIETKATSTNLADAVAAITAPGQHFTVRGVCHGITMIVSDLFIRGIRPKGAVKPVLNGDGLGSVLTLNVGATATIASLTITGGTGTSCGADCTFGGGILNRGTLTLDGVTVRGNEATYGGGIDNEGGTVTLAGRTTVRNNAALTTDGEGGGLTSYGGGIVTLTDRASVHHNAAGWGAGASLGHGSLVLLGSASIHHNTATVYGGGVYSSSGTLTITGQAAIHDNTAPDGGGYYGSSATMSGSYCATGSGASLPIHSNTPNNCVGD